MNEYDEFLEKSEYVDELNKKLTQRFNLEYERNKPVKVDGGQHTMNATIYIHGLFDSGVIVVTKAVDYWLKDETATPSQREYRQKLINLSLTRHFGGDWGSLDFEDYLQNEYAVNPKSPAYEGRIMSVYECDGMTIWIITECDRSATTVLFPSDY